MECLALLQVFCVPISMAAATVFGLHGAEMYRYLKRRSIMRSPKHCCLLIGAYIGCVAWSTIAFNLCWRMLMFALSRPHDDFAKFRIISGLWIGIILGLGMLLTSHFVPSVLLVIQGSLVGSIFGVLLISMKSGGLIPYSVLWPSIILASAVGGGVGISYLKGPIVMMQISQAVIGSAIFMLLYANLISNNLLIAIAKVFALENDFIINGRDRVIVGSFVMLSILLIGCQHLQWTEDIIEDEEASKNTQV